MILGASKVETLRDVLSNRAHASTAVGLASVPQFQAGRRQFPENLNGLGYFDFQKSIGRRSRIVGAKRRRRARPQNP